MAEAVQRATGRTTALGGAALPPRAGRASSEVAEAYIKQHEPSGSRRSTPGNGGRRWRLYVYPIIGEKSPGDVTTADVIAILKRDCKDDDGKTLGTLWNTYPETASPGARAASRRSSRRGRSRAASRTASTPRRGPAICKPCSRRKSKVKPVEHHPALPHAEVPALMAELVARADGPRGGGVASLALRFLILTAGRTGEVLGARWSEIDREARRWSIPKERMKMGKGHVVPLSRRGPRGAGRG